MNECYAAHCIKPYLSPSPGLKLPKLEPELKTYGITEENIHIVLGEHKIKDKTVLSDHDKWDKKLNR